jgi:hypothetical protein
LQGSQTDQTALNTIVLGLRQAGVNASVAPAGSGGYVKGITIDGQFIKLVGGNNQWEWLPGGDTSGSTDGTSSSTTGLQDPNAMALFNTLMERAKQSEVINPNDPIIKAQVDAYNAQGQRAGQNYLAQLAEKQGANANIGAETRASAETVGQQTGSYQATLMQQELTARRQEIEQALSGASGLLTAEQQMSLQKELQQISLAEQEWEFGQTNDRLWAFGGTDS